MEAQIKTLSDQVRYCLKYFPETRECDIALAEKIWKVFYKGLIVHAFDGKPCVRIEHLKELPREGNIKRIRAHIQNFLHEYLPESPETKRKRGWSEEKWLKAMGYPPLNPAGQFRIDLE